jgi:uncharacterized membrane protein YqjE
MMIRRRAEAGPDSDEDASVRTLLRRLGTDTESLLRAEVALAKLEFRELARQAALDGAKIGAAVAIAFVGGLAIVAWLVLVLGDLLGDSYGSAALIVGAVLLLAGGLLARAGMKGLQKSGAPHATVESLQTSKQWARAELQEFRRELRSPEASHPPELPRP